MPKILLAAAAIVLAADSPALGQWHYDPANLHAYGFAGNVASYAAARAAARELGGHLLAINDAAEQAFVQSVLSGLGITGRFWIGLSDAQAEGTWVWDSGEPFTYANWCAGEPNNSFGSEDYAEIFTSGCWNDNGSPPIVGPTTAIVELSFGDVVAFDVQAASCTSPFPVPLGAAGDPESVSWNGAGGATRPAIVTAVPVAGLPASGGQYLRLYANGAVPAATIPPGGPCPRPAPPNVNEVRIRIPHGTRGIAFAWELLNAEGTGGSFNDGMSIDVVNAYGGRIRSLAYADASAPPGPGMLPASCGNPSGVEAAPPGPQTYAFSVPALPAEAFLSIVCWNGGDNAVPSAAHLDSVLFWSTGPFGLEITAPFGPGSIRLANGGGGPGNPFLTAVALAPGSFPNGWFYGIDLDGAALLSQMLAGPPFTGLLDASGASSFTVASGIPPGIAIHAVSLRFGPGIGPGFGTFEATAPELFLTW